ncbi:MAG: hypothetical protein LAT63_09345 [Marinobacter sp.]|nr:hypothetical protein [Marinobacter sp.]
MKGKITPLKMRLLGWLLLAALLLAVVLAASRYLAEQSQQSPWVAVILNQQTYHLPRTQLPGLAEAFGQLSATELANLEQHLDSWTEAALATTFDKANTGIDRYLDWYYSMPGSYMRLLFALQSNLDELTSQKLTTYVLEDSGFGDALTNFGADYELALVSGLAASGQRIAAQLERGLVAQTTDETGSPQSILDLDTVLRLSFTPSPQDVQRWQTSAATTGVVGAGAVAMLTYRAVAPRLAQAGGSRAAQRAILSFAARLAPRTAAAVAAGGAAAGVAAPSGPGALVVGGIMTSVTLATFVATDFALLKAEEAALRPGKEAGLREGMQHMEVELRQQLAAGQAEVFNLLGQQLQTGLDEAWGAAGEQAQFHILGPRS